MKFKPRTIRELAEMICGDFRPGRGLFEYRSSSRLTRLFQEADTDYVHDGTTRAVWVSQVLEDTLSQPHQDAHTPPDQFLSVIRTLMDKQDSHSQDDSDRSKALAVLNNTLAREGYEAFYADDGLCYLRHVSTQRVASISTNPHRPLSKAETEKRAKLSSYLDSCSEDELIEGILLPMFRQLGFHRITAAGHKDKALEYGKDVWMRFTLPTEHRLYFGIQVKRGKLDAAGMTKNANVAEVLTQVRMMLGHEIFDPEISKKALVDHAFIIAGGEITKAAQNWLGGQLDASQRSQILFMDRDDLLNLFVVNNIPLPGEL